MASKTLRRLAKDHGSLHNSLPPNYLFPPSKEDSYADLTSLSILLAGPEGTPFSYGVFQLDLNIPPTYPQSPPTATFRTKIFHPNVDPATGAVCVDTLKRDWKPELTLKDVLITISCLLVYPNAASALNAEAGHLIEEDFREYERKAALWARMHAAVPGHLKGLVDEARNRGDADGVKDAKMAGKGKRRKDDDIQVLVQEVEAENNDEGAGNGKITAATPDMFGAGRADDRRALGLGLDMNVDSSVVMDTPTQPPPRRRKKPHDFSMPAPVEETAQPSTTAPSFSTVLSTPTPQPTSTLQPPTTNPNFPEAKRPRVAASSAITPQRRHTRTSNSTVDEPSWLNWAKMSPGSSPEESKSTKRKRETSERERLKAAGGCIKRYNSGQFGPRRGIERL
jgi:ubiquitin-conjugating enzyme E2 S